MKFPWFSGGFLRFLRLWKPQKLFGHLPDVSWNGTSGTSGNAKRVVTAAGGRLQPRCDAGPPGCGVLNPADSLRRSIRDRSERANVSRVWRCSWDAVTGSQRVCLRTTDLAN
jgi:hypothetical protein